MDVVCPTNQTIAITAATCAVEIPNQGGLEIVGVANGEEGLEVSFEVAELKYTVTEDGIFCPFAGTGGRTDGELISEEPVTAEGEEVDVSTAPLELETGGAEFTASSHPATVTAGGGVEILETEAGSLECESVKYAGELPEASATLAIAPTYAGCQAFGFLSATVHPQECELALQLESESTAQIDLVCPTEQAIAIAANTCAIEIPSQSGLEAANVAGGEGHLEIGLEIAEFEYTVTKDGFLCPFAGTGERSDGALISEEPATAEGEEVEINTTVLGLEVE